jgi:hypothetical protein
MDHYHSLQGFQGRERSILSIPFGSTAVNVWRLIRPRYARHRGSCSFGMFAERSGLGFDLLKQVRYEYIYYKRRHSGCFSLFRFSVKTTVMSYAPFNENGRRAPAGGGQHGKKMGLSLR